MKSSLRVLCVGVALAAVSPSWSREPTELEQYYLELVNRARANPGAEVTRLSSEVWGDTGSPATPNLNEGLPAGTLAATARPPLAFDTRLIESADVYSRLLLDTEQFTHTANGTNCKSRMEAQGYVFVPTSGSGENLAVTASSGPHPVDKTRVEAHHSGLFVDGDVAGRGHRKNLLEGFFREVGIAILADTDNQSMFDLGFHDVLSAQNFATSSGRVFVTGVIYNDGNDNHFYDPGESAGALALTVENSSGTQVASGTSFASGGYSINMGGLPAGTYLLVADDGSGAESEVQFIWNGAINVKIDLINPFIPHRPDLRIGKTATLLTGNGIYSDNAIQQSIKQIAVSLRPLFWNAVIENDGKDTDDLLIRGTPGTRLFRVNYFRNTSGVLTNETAALATGVFTNGVTNSDQIDYLIRVNPNRSARGKRTGFTSQLRVVSSGDSTKVDRVNAVVQNRTRKPRR